MIVIGDARVQTSDQCLPQFVYSETPRPIRVCSAADSSDGNCGLFESTE